jgi:hypothetical protein
MRTRMPLITAWITFIAGAAFFAVMMPLGEGFDELWHFAYIQHIAQLGTVPESHATLLSREGMTFLQLHPVAWAVHNNFPMLPSYEQYWQHADNNRSLDEQLANLRFEGRYSETAGDASFQYESHQAPLYYFISAPVFAWASHRLSFVQTFTAMRLFSILLTSFLVPGTFLLANSTLKDSYGAANATALLVLFPGLYPSIARVSNDALVLPLACWTLLCLVRFLEESTNGRLFTLQLLLIAGLWTKAFFLPIAAGVVLCLVFAGRFRAAALIALLSMLGTPWYIANFVQSHALTGLPEEIAGTTSNVTIAQALSKMNWLNLFRVLRSSHIWTGNWSFLSVRIWMYQVVFGIYILGIVGLLRGRLQNPKAVAALATCYVSSIAGLIYYGILVFRAGGTSVTEGWYLAPMIPAEIVLFAAGIQSLFGKHRRWLFIFSQTCLMLLLAYTAAFIEMPYYSGMTAHAANGQLAAYHPRLFDFGLMTHRLLRFQPSIPAVLPWFLLGAFVIFWFYSIRNGLAGGSNG